MTIECHPGVPWYFLVGLGPLWHHQTQTPPNSLSLNNRPSWPPKPTPFLPTGSLFFGVPRFLVALFPPLLICSLLKGGPLPQSPQQLPDPSGNEPCLPCLLQHHLCRVKGTFSAITPTNLQDPLPMPKFKTSLYPSLSALRCGLALLISIIGACLLFWGVGGITPNRAQDLCVALCSEINYSWWYLGNHT